VLAHIHRSRAIHIWSDALQFEHCDLEEILSAFGLFMPKDEDYRWDVQSTKKALDKMIKDFWTQNNRFQELTRREKALSLLVYMRKNQLVGLTNPEKDYRNLENNFLSWCLQSTSEPRPSLPMISAALYCCLAKRVGLKADLCNYPGHVYVKVTSELLRDLNGEIIESFEGTFMDGQPNPVKLMFLDPFQSDTEVLSSDLMEQLRTILPDTPELAQCLSTMSVENVMIRMSNNINYSVDETQRQLARNSSSGGPFADQQQRSYMVWGSYVALWALNLVRLRTITQGAPVGFLLPQHESTILAYLKEAVERHFIIDFNLVDAYILPLLRQHSQMADVVENGIQTARWAASRPRDVKQRSANDKLKYEVGQVFAHKRYRYEGVITGWDRSCEADLAWRNHHDIDEVARQRCFYHVLVQDGTTRYVDENNIELLHLENGEEPNEGIFYKAGLYFKRWDGERGRFVSNIKGEYPTD
jgi:F-box protein 21